MPVSKIKRLIDEENPSATSPKERLDSGSTVPEGFGITDCGRSMPAMLFRVARLSCHSMLMLGILEVFANPTLAFAA